MNFASASREADDQACSTVVGSEKLADIGKLVSERMTKPLEIDPELQAQATRRSHNSKN